MRALTAMELVQVWDWGAERRPVERALALLRVALERPWDELSALSIGQRDGLLLQLRGATLGEELEVYVRCPRCEHDLEFSMRASDLVVADPLLGRTAVRTEVDGAILEVRPPTSEDLVAVEEVADPAAARARLLSRVVLQGPPSSGAGEGLSPEVAEAVAKAVLLADPQLDLRFDLSCESCGHGWVAPFDILAFFWEEITAQVKQISLEVDELARAYGWHERDILAMSARRRRWYLDLVRG